MRANKAFTTLLANKKLFSTLGDHTLDPTDLTVKHLTGIPGSDSMALKAAGIDANGVTWATKCSTLVVHQTLSMANSPGTFLPGGPALAGPLGQITIAHAAGCCISHGL
ncbi:hypothetical protein [Mesorhizobium sp. WSM3224]|uniref:hypothetical protein n=1 Tax=Mesorhizobium sp. WSM3224 TaxID=1040986 RepID=UPI0012ECA806|nr:hypothetical protein [Mesorhizobium sp. WSM3224]